MIAFHSPLTSRSTVRPAHSTIERTFSTGQSVCAAQRVEWGERKQPRRCYQHRAPGPNHYEGVAAMSISDHGAVSPEYAPATSEERLSMATIAELNHVIEQAVADHDMQTWKAAWAEKWSIERALGESRWETFNRWMDREFFGGGS